MLQLLIHTTGTAEWRHTCFQWYYSAEHEVMGSQGMPVHQQQSLQ
jgi:hypothetical protein